MRREITNIRLTRHFTWAAALVVVAGLGFASAAPAAIICVPSSFDGACGSDQPTIAAGIAAANVGGGDTVLVDNGLYTGTVTIDRPLTLQAFNGATEADAGNAAAQAILDGGGAENTVTVLEGVDGAVIDGFEITNPTHNPLIVTSPAGIIVQTDNPVGATVTVTITNNVVHEVSDPTRGAEAQTFGEAGILAFNIGSGALIAGNTIYDLSDSAPPTSGGESPGSGRAQGILVKSPNATASGVTISGNTLHDIQDVAIRYNGVVGTTTGDVTGNTIDTVGSAGTGFLSGIGIDHVGLGAVSGNTISNVTGGFGLGIQATGTATIAGNVITSVAGGNGAVAPVFFPGAGMLIQTDGMSVTNNVLSGNAIGITIGTFVATGAAVNTNCISGNGAGLVNGGNAAVDAEDNWWGSADGPSGDGPGSGDSVVDAASGTIDFAPFSTTQNCSVCDDRFVDTAGADVANDCTSIGTPCATIQHAVDEVPVPCVGVTVNAAAGTYDEQVEVVGKSVTILGAGAGSTIVKPSAVTANSSHVVSAAAFAVVMLVEDTDDTTIEGLTVDGTDAAFGACSPGYIGIFYRNASGTIESTEVANMVHPGAGGCQSVLGILVQTAGGESSVVVINENEVTNYGKNGITCNFVGSDCTITDNTVIGRGPLGAGEAAQNGIQIGAGSVGSILGNTASGNYYTPMSFCATGVLVVDSNGIEVRNNVLFDNLCDLNLQNSDTSVVTGNEVPAALEFPFSIIGDGNIVDKNYVNGSVYDGMYVDGLNNAVTCNRLTNNGGAGIFYGDFFSPFTGATPNSANENTITGNLIGVDGTNVSPPPDIDATNNWWGCAAGPGNVGCDTVTANVDASSPAASEPLCVTCAGVGGDTDDDGVCDPDDNCVGTPNPGQTDTDGDGAGDACDPCPLDDPDDTDLDLICDSDDTCPLDPDNDIDGDGICGDVDNCPDDANPGQDDFDSDTIGDACDSSDVAGFSLRRLKMQASEPGRGRYSVKGEIDATPTPAFLTQIDLDGVTVIIENQLGSLVSFTFSGADCVEVNNKVKCRNGATGSTFNLAKRSAPLFFRVKATVKKQTFTQPLAVDEAYVVRLQTPIDLIDRRDDIIGCADVSGGRTLRCKDVP
jgi:hypothetical protein